uniref:Uncharacterized protein n=1 Tax=Strongyloides stercoralis TaxID=6248 RepID=A0A0K0E6Q4_STRER
MLVILGLSVKSNSYLVMAYNTNKISEDRVKNIDYHNLWFYLKIYGWYLAYEEYKERKNYEKIKKFDDIINEKYSKNLQEARKKIQEEYEKKKLRYKEEEENKKKVELEEKIHALDKKINNMARFY